MVDATKFDRSGVSQWSSPMLCRRKLHSLGIMETPVEAKREGRQSTEMFLNPISFSVWGTKHKATTPLHAMQPKDQIKHRNSCFPACCCNLDFQTRNTSSLLATQTVNLNTTQGTADSLCLALGLMTGDTDFGNSCMAASRHGYVTCTCTNTVSVTD